MRRLIGLMVVSSALVAMAVPAGATFPGGNGKIAFYTYNGDPAQIGTVDPDGTDRTILTDGPRPKRSPAWSADGSTIAFISTVNGASRLVTMAADGTGNATVFASSVWKYLGAPSWSPDGTQIAVDAAREGSGFRILVINVDGSGFSVVPSRSHMTEPAWSPDGTRIAYVRDLENIFTMASDGTDRQLVTSGHWPSWSPDSSRIVFTDRSSNDVFVIDADGTDRTRLTDTPRRFEFAPVFSPDGTRIAFDRTVGSDPFDPDDIWLMDTDGTNAVRIIDTPRVDEFDLDWQAT